MTNKIINMNAKLMIGLMATGLSPAIAASQPVEADSASAQRHQISIGPIAENSLSGFFHSGISEGKSRMDEGCTLGAFLNFEITKNLSVQGEMLFNYRTSDFSWTAHSGTYRYWGICIPIYVMYAFELPDQSHLYVGVGPYTDFGLGARFKEGSHSMDVYARTESSGLPAMKDSDTGFGLKVGYEWPIGLQINAGYRVSVTNVVDANSSSVKMHPHAVSLGIAYRFKL